MSIESNAAPDELSSPFYVANKKLCLQWEKYILNHDGKINGRYNAWSFSLKTKVKTKLTPVTTFPVYIGHKTVSVVQWLDDFTDEGRPFDPW